MDKKFAPHVPGQRAALQGVGVMAGRMLRNRVDGRGIDADGRPLPKVGKGGMRTWWFMSAKDPRFKKYHHIGLVRNVRGSKGSNPPKIVWYYIGYDGWKSQISGKTRRGQSLTGDAWSSLSISIRDRGVGKKLVRVGFSGSVRTGFVSDPTKKSGRRSVRVRNREKMMLTQFSKRQGGTEYRSGAPAGRPEFTLMALSSYELATIRDEYVKKLRMFKPADSPSAVGFEAG